MVARGPPKAKAVGSSPTSVARPGKTLLLVEVLVVVVEDFCVRGGEGARATLPRGCGDHVFGNIARCLSGTSHRDNRHLFSLKPSYSLLTRDRYLQRRRIRALLHVRLMQSESLQHARGPPKSKHDNMLIK